MSLKIDQFIELERQQLSNPYRQVGRWVSRHLPAAYHQSHADSVSPSQFESKSWCHRELQRLSETLNFAQADHIEILGAWFGWPLLEFIETVFSGARQIDLYDKDPHCHKVVAQYKHLFTPRARVVQFGDWFERREIRTRQVLLNPSGEHMPPLFSHRSYQEGNPVIVVLSNDNSSIPGHTHCVRTVDELIEQQRLRTVYFTGQLRLPEYTRFMAIGRWD